MSRNTVFAVVLVGAATGCARTVPPPNDAWAAAQQDVGRAESGGAPAVPDAKLHLQLAEEDLQRAKQLIGQDNARATTLTDLARAEAQLALSLAKSAAAQGDAQKAATDLQKVEQGK
jgi:Domain of unknown function (DUF4398)